MSRPWDVDSLARALVRLVEEHGAPNSFAPSEISDKAGGEWVLRPTRIGRIGCGYLDDMQAAVRDNFATFTVTYNRERRRFYVEPTGGVS